SSTSDLQIWSWTGEPCYHCSHLMAGSAPRPAEGHNGLYEEGGQTCGHEGCGPDKIEVQPCFAEKREAEPSIDYPGDQPCDCEISSRVDGGGEDSCERAGGRRDVMVGGHSGLCFD